MPAEGPASHAGSTCMAPCEASRREKLAALSPPAVKRALVHATSVLTTRDHERQCVHSIDMRPLVIHLLAGLEQAGIERAVVTLGHDAAQIADCVTAYGFNRMQIDFVYLTLGCVAGAVWSNLANSVIAARAAFTGTAPLLIVRADNLYDSRLLRKIADAPFGTRRRCEAYALIDATPAIVKWARAARPNWPKVVLAQHDRGLAVRCRPRLGACDAIVAGEAYATTPRLFELLAGLFSHSLSTSIADAMAELADRGQLGVVECAELDCHWFTSLTVSAIFQPGNTQWESWNHVHRAARDLLYSGEWRPTANMPTKPLRGELEKRTEPLLQLGSTLGEGAHGVVVEAEPGRSASRGLASSRLAVKICSVGRDAQAHEQSGRNQEEAVMWEVHVLRQLRGHEHIVKLCDVVELTDAVYVVMERIDGPCLLEYIQMQPGGVLDEPTARHLFRHVLSALRHAHGRGLLHCDVKPANVRLDEGRDGTLSAVLVDWGLARQMHKQPAHITEGTTLYASPEQLTGYNADCAWGRAKLGPPADVWALGVTLYQMLVGRLPFECGTHEELVALVLALNYDTRPDIVTLGARQLIDSMLQVQPCDRASIGELCIDQWTIADGPMAPEAGSVSVELTKGGRESPPAVVVSGRAKRLAMYLGYAVLIGGLLVFCATRDVGLSPIQEQTDPGVSGA